MTKPKKKIFVLLPDGVSLRNFAYTSFYSLGIEKGYEVIFWNATPFDIKSIGFSEIKIDKPKAHWYTNVLKNAQKHIEIKLFSERDKDPIYFEYLFPLSYKNIKASAKSLLVRFYSKLYCSEKKLGTLRAKIVDTERKTTYYQACKEVLEKEQPDFVFCTSQRSVTAIAPLTAAQDLGIPTGSFIFSWDNVPKATTVITTDHYFVWSELMQKELLHYHRYIDQKQVNITGTPQFEPHFEESRILSRDAFCKKYHLDPNTTYLCYSGDDITTSPKDELYVRDVAEAVRKLNTQGLQLKIIFRRCPVDFSGRYDTVLKDYNDILIDIPPLWKKIGGGWNTILPTAEDLNLQANIIAHTKGVINLASSMVFDYVAHDKPCAYMNYNYLNPEQIPQKGVYLYDYVHFRSMPSSQAVVWLDHPNEIAGQIEKMLSGIPKTVTEAKEWFKIVNLHPPQYASERIWNRISKIVN